MGRELRRKQAKREGKNVREVQKINKDKPLSPKTFAIIIGVLLLFFVILYILTGLFIQYANKLYPRISPPTSDISPSALINLPVYES